MSNRRKYRSGLSWGIKILDSLDTEFSKHCAALLREGKHHEYLNVEIDVNRYTSWIDFYNDYQAAELLSKYDGLELNVDREHVALDKFISSEENCQSANMRLAGFHAGALVPPDVWQVIKLASASIERLLGSFSWVEAECHMGFGPGANRGVPRKRAQHWYKFGVSNPTATGELAHMARGLVDSSHAWLRAMHRQKNGGCFNDVSIVDSSRFHTVPKNAKTDRVICIEPLMNMYVQKGIGMMIRKRLKRVGVNLNDQGENQTRSCEASTSGHMATLDLSAASDNISLAAVELLLPSEWVFAMKVARTPKTVLPSGEVIRLQKFSAMGNGYTFELESLIFWAVCKECVVACGGRGHDVGVYGDDLIVPVGAVELVRRVLSYLGFSLNVKKSHDSGLFRESCGKHWFAGRDVTPLYIREDVDSTHRKLWLANSVKRLAFRFNGLGYGLDGRFRCVYDDVVRRLPERVQRLSIPEGFGDGGLVRDLDEALPRRHRYFDAYKVTTLQDVTPMSLKFDRAAYCIALHRMRGNRRVPWYKRYVPLRRLATTVDAELEVSPIGITSPVADERFVKSLTTQWGCLGPWLIGSDA